MIRWMRSAVAAAALGPFLSVAAAAPPAPAPAPAVNPEGLWQGTLIYKPAELEVDIIVELARDANGKWVGTMDLLNQNLKLHPLENVRVAGTAVSWDFNRFAKKAQMMVETPVTATLSADGTALTGDFFEGKTNHVPLALKKIGAAGSDRPAEHRSEVHPLSANGEELRAQFNRDAGKVRLVMLLSPT